MSFTLLKWVLLGSPDLRGLRGVPSFRSLGGGVRSHPMKSIKSCFLISSMNFLVQDWRNSSMASLYARMVFRSLPCDWRFLKYCSTAASTLSRPHSGLGCLGLRKEHLAPDPAANVVFLRACPRLRRGRCLRERTSVCRRLPRSEGDRPLPGGARACYSPPRTRVSGVPWK